jgi:hypothetical protein
LKLFLQYKKPKDEDEVWFTQPHYIVR